MIDLHCHLLPGIDDGSPDEATSLEMARIAVADGIHTTARTPHIYPGLYENDFAGIKSRVAALQRRLFDEGIALKLTLGADAHPHDVVVPTFTGTTPETYLGTARADGWLRPPLPGRHSYTQPSSALSANTFAYGGTWDIHETLRKVYAIS